MVFLPVICLVLAVFFGYTGYRHENKVMISAAVCMLIAAFGTGLITYFALSAL